MEKQKVAVIGSGISGISAAYFLSKKFDVHLFEKNDYLGGHTRTKSLFNENDKIKIDTGFIVFNNDNYPDLVEFFNLLKIETAESNMSFSVSIKNIDLEYGSNKFSSIFAKKYNFFSIFFWKLLIEIFKLYRQCKENHKLKNLQQYTLGEFLDKYKYSDNIKYFHIYPMIAAIWSCNKSDVKNLPLVSFINFFNNHKLFNLSKRHQWRYIKNGSNSYIRSILNKKMFKYELRKEVKKIIRYNDKVKIIFNDNNEFLAKKIIVATHANQALKFIESPSENEINILSKFKYTKNYAYLHSDEKLMPNRKSIWSSWNFVTEETTKNSFSLTYWMNLLQNIQSKKNYFVTINPNRIPQFYYDKTVFEHPIFNLDTLEAQKNFNKIQGTHNTWYCGSYCGYGFHEDGIQSSAYIANLLNISLPWQRKDNFYNRLNYN